MRNLTLRQLEVFATVARLLSFSKAARELNVTQPAVSMQIQQLEAVAGLALFERNRRKISLTEAGQKLLVCASGMDDLLHEAEQLMDVVGLPMLSDWYLIHTLEKRLLPIASAFRDFPFARGGAIIETTIGIASKSRKRRVHHAKGPRRRAPQPLLLSPAD